MITGTIGAIILCGASMAVGAFYKKELLAWVKKFLNRD